MTEQPASTVLPLQGMYPENGHRIDGERKIIQSINPVTKAVLGEVPVATPEDIQAVMQRVRAAQPAWASRPLTERIDLLRSFQKSLYRHHEAMVQMLADEAGKVLHEARIEMIDAFGVTEYYVKVTKKALKPQPRHVMLLPYRRQKVVRKPYGVVLVIAPWNFPLLLSLTPIIAALVAGNTVVYKPSEYGTQTGELIKKALYDAGFPEDVFQIVHGYGDVGAALIDAHPDKICFTGSETTGRKIAAKAGEHLIPVIMELGGKDAAIVLEDADIERTARGLVWAGVFNAGQMCVSIERVYVMRPVADQLIERMKYHMEKSVCPGPNSDPHSTYGAIITEAQAKIIQRQVEDARAKGATVMTFSEPHGDNSERFYAPTLITNVKPDMEVMQRETFGPVIPVIPVDSEEEAIRLHNDSEYGLTGSVWTEDAERGKRIMEKLNVGVVSINDHVVSMSTPEMPWGGVKASGYGRTRGIEGLHEMTYTQTFSTERFRLPFKFDLFWLPYTPFKRAFLRRFFHLWFGATFKDRLKAFKP